MKKVVRLLKKMIPYLGIILFMTVTTIYFTLLVITHGPSLSARNLFATTMLETGALKWMVGLVLDDNTVQEIVNNNKLVEMTEEVNSELIEIQEAKTKEEIEIHKVNGSNYKGTMMIVHDPSRISVTSSYPFGSLGLTLKDLVKKVNGIGGINGGLYYQGTSGQGNLPRGVLVQNSEIVYNAQDGKGYVLIGFDTNNILKIITIDGMTKEEIEELIKKENIRDAVTFQEEATDQNNHFVKLIINGESRESIGSGSGANPRTAIGQTSDGSVLLFVTDGRGANGHLGATAQDLIEVMEKYGAINAANIDGGSSSCMYYKDEYLMTSTTLYYTNSSWRMPDAFVIN